MKNIKTLQAISLKRVLSTLVIAAMALTNATAQVKVTANGAVSMSKDLTVEKKTTINLSSGYDTSVSSTNSSSPINHISQLVPLKFSAAIPVPLNYGETASINTLTPIDDLGLIAKDHYGFSLLEFSQYYPELVNYDVNNKAYVNYTELIPILVQAIKDLSARVESLEAAAGINGNDSNPSFAPMKTNISSNLMLTECTLYQNTPNPFTERTQIRFDIPQSKNNAYICIYDLQGTLKKQLRADAAQGYVVLEASSLTPGMYLYSLIVDNKEIDTKRMILSK